MKKIVITITSLIACAFCFAAEAAKAPVAPATPAAPAAQNAQATATVAVVAVPAENKCCQEKRVINTLADEEVLAPAFERFSASATVGMETEYVFRGLKEAGLSINPELDIAYDLGQGFSLYAGVWANTPANQSNVTNEIDLYAGLLYEIKNITFDLGYASYIYTDEANTNEIKFGVSYDTVDFLGEFNVSPAVALYYDFDLGVYTVEGGLSYSAPVTKWIADRNWGTIELAAVYGWATEANDAGYTYTAISADAVIAVNEYCNFSFGVRYAYAHSVNSAWSTNRYQDRVWFGSSVTIGF